MGLRALLNRTDTWPPNLVEFRQLCTEYDPGSWERQAHKVVDRSTLLEDKTSQEEKLDERKKALASMREDLGI